MNIYNLSTVEQSTISDGNISTTYYQFPIDINGNPVEYLSKFRIIKDGQMVVFDTEQEYRDWLIQNT
mgnify:CR=1 FL=1